MNRFIYSFFFYLATPLILARLCWRGLRASAYYSRWGERFALGVQATPVDVVIHAVSVGEVHAAMPLINRLLAAQPPLRLLVTTMTPTGSARVKELLGDRVSHVYLPYDYPGAMRRFLAAWQPRLLVIMETELWPNLIHQCARSGVSTMLANARLSAQSSSGYYRFAGLARDMLGKLDRVTAQSDQDSKRLQDLGLPGDRVSVAGNMKYDVPFDSRTWEQALHDKAALGGRPVWIAASTRSANGDAEETLVLEALRRLLGQFPDLLLVLVPRHPERFDEVHDLVTRQGLRAVRRSGGDAVQATHQVLLGDTMGEMTWYYGLADIAYVGGSLVPTGCQNIIEPAALGLPVVTGPSLYNFQAVSEQLQAAGGMSVVANTDALAMSVNTLLADAALRRNMGEAARSAVAANQGATARNQAVISELLVTARRSPE